MKLRYWQGLGDEVAITGLIRELRLAYPREIITVEGNRYPELLWHSPHLGVRGDVEPTDNGQTIELLPAPNDRIGNFVHAQAQFCGLSTVSSGEPEIWITQAEVAIARQQLGKAGLCMPVVMIDTWAAWPRRRWPFERFVEVTKAYQAKGWRVIEVGTTAPDSQGAKRTQRLPLHPDDCWLDLYSLRETAALLSQVNLFIGNDSGLAHVAAAVQTPAVVIYTVPWYARAYRYTYPVFSLQHECVGCEKTCARDLKESCLGAITVEHVLNVAGRVPFDVGSLAQ